ncbi:MULTISPECIES: APC family permease [unclassified Nocardioides]|uniref:APC family permease n=1 Tax=unclassified Nocardioides TaxID=2615069 RepID=UPI000702D239|nr:MULTISPECIES: APC family permease [unclassified Nocardioides]KRC48845.1 amino acid permease [Nocardioides sp. Root79]KRC75244.1 amino acid permease [Nocardioides sp. Root240]
MAVSQEPAELAPPAQTVRHLTPVLGLAGAVLMTVSCITPTSSLFIIVPEVLASQGSGAVIALVVGVVISVAVGACYAELGTRTPSSGGEYAMITHTLGRTLGWLTFTLTAALLVVIPPIIALGTADYLSSIVTVDRAAAGAVVMLLATFTAILDMRSNAFVTAIFLGIETVAATVVAYLGFTHAERGVGSLLKPHALDGSGALNPYTLGVLMAGLAVAMFVVNGFGTASYLAEEIIEPRKNVARAVFLSLFISAVIIIVPTAAVIIGAGSLTDLGELGFPDFVEAWAGSDVAAAVSVGIAIAIFNAVIVMMVQNGRVIYATGRDRTWPEPINKALTRMHPRFNTPYVATLVVGGAGALLAYLVDIEALLGVTSVIVSVVFILLAVGALTVRRTPHAGWHMPLWPLAPVVVIGALGYALLGSAAVDLVITGVIVVVALAYELLYLRPRRDERFLVDALEER